MEGNNMKRIIATTLCFIMISLSFGSISAKSDKQITIKGTDGRKAKITIEATVDKVPDSKLLQTIVDENPDCDNFII